MNAIVQEFKGDEILHALLKEALYLQGIDYKRFKKGDVSMRGQAAQNGKIETMTLTVTNIELHP